MKADYKNWMPRGLIYGNAGVSSVFLAVGLLCRKKKESRALRLLSSLSFVGAGVGFLSSAYLLMLYRIFSYNGKRKLAKHIIDGVASRIKLPTGGKGLDVGCGSGALTIAAAKRNPEASFVGVDRWGRNTLPLVKNYAKITPAPKASKTYTFSAPMRGSSPSRTRALTL